MALSSLRQIGLLCRHFRCRHVLKDERNEKLTKQTVRTDIVAQLSPLLGELALNATDEDFDICHGIGISKSAAKVQLIFELCKRMADFSESSAKKYESHTHKRNVK